MASSSWILIWVPTKDIQASIQASAKSGENVDIRNTPSGKLLTVTKIDESEEEHQSLVSKEDESVVEEERRKNKEEDKIILYSLEETLETVLPMMNITCYTCSLTKNGQFILVQFCVPSNQVEVSLITLQQHGIGTSELSSISVLPATVHVSGNNPIMQSTTSNEEKKNVPNEQQLQLNKGEQLEKLEGRIDRFYDSVKSRMLVAEVVTRIRAGGEFTFDFLMLLFLSGCIAFMGLLENSSVVLVASMLVSPLMGPILAGIFGCVIKDKQLFKMGLLHETIALFICILLGFVCGMIFCPWIEAYGVSKWPTEEMLSRCSLRSLYVGVLIAVPSGAGVALSVLGGNTGSLVAVNCGIFFAIASIAAISGNPYLVGYESPWNETNSSLPLYEASYASVPEVEAICLGLVSLALTMINIVCIIIFGIAILKLKEVTPDRIPQSFSTFWREDIKIHREYYNTFKHGQDDASNRLIQEVRELLGVQDEGLEGTFLQNMFDKAQQENDTINIQEWIPIPTQPKPFIRSAIRQYSRCQSVDVNKSKRISVTMPTGAKARRYTMDQK